MKMNWEFKQSEYRAEWDRQNSVGGLCLSLSARWCRAMLESEKDGWGAPTASAEERFKCFKQQPVATDVVSTQAVFSRRMARAREGGQTVETLIQVATVLNKHHPVETHTLLAAIDLAADELVVRGPHITDSTITHFGLRVAATAGDVKWGAIAASLATQQCYVAHFETGAAGGHALGIYQTYGWVSTDYYVFDPNFGEVLCNGSDDFTKLMSKIKAVGEYRNPDSITLRTVQLA